MTIHHITASAPGRVNLIGDHTDYERGAVLPCAIDRGTSVTMTVDPSRSQGSDPCLHFQDLPPDAHAQRRVATAIVETAGSLTRESQRSGDVESHVSDIEVTSTLPIGAGLSSSTALAAAAVLCWDSLRGKQRTALQLRRLIAQTEQHATGVATGTMDQRVIVGAHAHHAMLIDCAHGRVKHLPLPETLVLRVIFSGTQRQLGTSRYAARRQELEAIKQELGVSSLCGIAPSTVAKFPRAHHVASEHRRALAAARALEASDLEHFGALMNASHASLRDDFEVSTPALDVITRCFQDAGAFGARLTGAGDGGCVIAALPSDHSDVIAAVALRAAEAELGTKLPSWQVRATAGVAQTGQL